MTVEGGHAIMLDVHLPDFILDAGKKWVEENTLGRTLNPNHHLTLAFVGRNLEESIGNEMLRLVDRMKPNGRLVVYFAGSLAIYGAKYTHLAASCITDPRLLSMRNLVTGHLRNKNIHLESRWGFDPHVTLAVSRTMARAPKDVLPKCELPVMAILTKIGDTIHRKEL